MNRHRELRPLWICRACAAPWPCGTARLALLADYADDPVGLRVDLAALLPEVARDLFRLNPFPGPDPTDLFTRFVGWTQRPEQRS